MRTLKNSQDILVYIQGIKHLFIKPYSRILFVVLFFSCSNGTAPTEAIAIDTTLASAKEDRRNFSSFSTTICEQTKLSNQFVLSVNLKRYTDTLKRYDSCSLTILITDKRTKRLADSIMIISLGYFHNTFSGCDAAMSFSTGYKIHRRIVDGYFGDIVVADLNFDGKDDIAIIADIGSSSGVAYNYYTQKANLTFEMDSFLTDSVTYFPTKIDKSRHELVTYLNAGAYSSGKHIYRFDKSTSVWKQIEHKIISVRSTE